MVATIVTDVLACAACLASARDGEGGHERGTGRLRAFATDRPFLDMIGPVCTRAGESGVLLGLRARNEHLNTRGFVHGTVLAALLDVVCGRNCAMRAGQPGLVTVSLTVDFVAGARDGDWLEASATVTRVGRRLAFSHGWVEAEGKPAAAASGVFAVG